MKDDTLGVSRRKLLGAMGTIGGAAALGGASTMAFFSDEEEFSNNELVAGELDLKVDWQEYYSDWSPDESAGLRFDPVMDLEDIPDSNPDGLTPDPSDPASWIAFPPALDDLLYVWAGDADQFIDNTAVDAYPDSDGDDLRDDIRTRREIGEDNRFLPDSEIERLYREQFADVPDDLQGRRPLIDLTDVKPGDFGEVTFSVHLFDNPGYLWLEGGIHSLDENGTTEPERRDEDEEEGVVELLDEIRVAVWHDDGNDVLNDVEDVIFPKPADGPDADENLEIPQEQALITQGTLRDLLELLSADTGIPLDADPTTSGRDCFPNSTTRFVGFAWWLPVDHANEIQTDSVTFDLGFYTEQCRHNDGSGMIPEGRSSVSVTASDPTTDSSSRHQVEVEVGDDLDGHTLGELVVDYPSDFDISGVAPADASDLSYDVDSSFGGALPQVVPTVTQVNRSDDDTRISFTLSNSLPLAALERFSLEYGDAQNASSARTYSVDAEINGVAVGSAELSITT
ncbi:SipW-dependent-type signal peptide-containing protein [Salinigranum salinum]|uniref:SipW-dependent-type signal peptide-containing protein n=1 Tax=Salinigranum salinum TaxID=1364937 RepID=UPI0012609965|nr:SipW-dependent-type signal peptide-containing protein [Salinigranum salinum]